jgi:3-deoxy-manno-octulosonate cytidylyltransferase (CMP-KDO synthetase)
MIVHVWRRAMEADIGPVVVAAAEAEIAWAVEQAGGQAVLTRPDHPSGSDRVFEALEALDPEGRVETVVNLQGDLPTLDPALVRAAIAPLANPAVDLATLAVEIVEERERTDPNVVKAILSVEGDSRIARALYFTRATAPSGEGPLYHHIGLYAWRRAALARFVTLPPAPLERRERLESLKQSVQKEQERLDKDEKNKTELVEKRLNDAINELSSPWPGRGDRPPKDKQPGEPK